MWLHSSVSGGSRSRVPRTALMVWLMTGAGPSVSAPAQKARIAPMLQRHLQLASATLLLAALPFVHSAYAVAVRLTEGDGSRVQVALHPGDVLRIELGTNPVAGWQWGVRGHSPPQLMELGKTQRVFGGRMSDQGTSRFAWRAVDQGEGELTLVYGSSASRVATPKKTYTVQLVVAGDALGPEETHPPPVSQMKQVAAYDRTEPCGDCSGLAEHLVLYRAPGETPFVLRRTYKDA